MQSISLITMVSDCLKLELEGIEKLMPLNKVLLKQQFIPKNISCEIMRTRSWCPDCRLIFLGF